MAIYDNRPLVVVEDSMYETLSFCRSILDRREFGTGLHKLKWVTLSNLSAFSADRLDAFGTLFYVFDTIRSADEYKDRYYSLTRPAYKDVIMLYGKDREQPFEDVPTDKHLYSVGIVCREDYDEEMPDSQKQALTMRCLKLLLMLISLAPLETPSLKHEQIVAHLDPDHERLLCAVLCKLYDFGNEKAEKEQAIQKKRDEIERLKKTKPKVYSCKNFSSYPEDLSFTPSAIKDARKLYQELFAFYTKCDGVLDETVGRDIASVRFAMASIDWYIRGGAEPTCMDSYLPDAEHPLPNERDLLRRCPTDETMSINIQNALQASRRFMNVEKPSVKKFITATLCGIGAFLLSVPTVYLIRAFQSADFRTALLDSLPMTWIPLVLLLAAGTVGAVLCLRHYNRILSILKEIAGKMAEYTAFVSRKIREIRQYLNDFITVFYNCHSRDFRIMILDRGITEIESALKQLLAGMTPYNELADHLKEICCKQNDKREQEIADEEYLNPTDDLYTDSFDSVDAYTPSRAKLPTDKKRNATAVDSDVSRKNEKECLEHIRSKKTTNVVGPDCEPFEHRCNPFLSGIRFV